MSGSSILSGDLADDDGSDGANRDERSSPVVTASGAFRVIQHWQIPARRDQWHPATPTLLPIGVDFRPAAGTAEEHVSDLARMARLSGVVADNYLSTGTDGRNDLVGQHIYHHTSEDAPVIMEDQSVFEPFDPLDHESGKILRHVLAVAHRPANPLGQKSLRVKSSEVCSSVKTHWTARSTKSCLKGTKIAPRLTMA